MSLIHFLLHIYAQNKLNTQDVAHVSNLDSTRQRSSSKNYELINHSCLDVVNFMHSCTKSELADNAELAYIKF